MAKSKTKNTLPVAWDAKMAEFAKQEAARTTAGGGGEYVGTQGGQFSFQGEILGKELVVIVVDFVHHKIWNPWPYEPNSKEFHPPGCFAFSEDGQDFAPHEDVPDQQSEKCEDCPHNEWGSGKVGQSKACNDRRLLAVIHGDADDLEEAAIVGVSVSPNGLKAWDGYVSNLAKVRRRPYFSVKTKLSLVPKGTFHYVSATMETELPPAIVDQILERREAARNFLMTAPNVVGYKPYEEPVRKSGRSAFSKGKK